MAGYDDAHHGRHTFPGRGEANAAEIVRSPTKICGFIWADDFRWNNAHCAHQNDPVLCACGASPQDAPQSMPYP